MRLISGLAGCVLAPTRRCEKVMERLPELSLGWIASTIVDGSSRNISNPGRHHRRSVMVKPPRVFRRIDHKAVSKIRPPKMVHRSSNVKVRSDRRLGGSAFYSAPSGGFHGPDARNGMRCERKGAPDCSGALAEGGEAVCCGSERVQQKPAPDLIRGGTRFCVRTRDKRNS
jgi:hypothetical protein